jgi:murein DD-endopeptidase MepM/ murein hydrolase activator NlpD
VDLRTEPGQRVRAAGDGRVAFAGTIAGRGVVAVDHGILRTTYEPVDAQVVVGERVRVGEVLGTVATGTGHCGSGSCLHLGLRRGPEYLDPLLLLSRASARLRPW